MSSLLQWLLKSFLKGLLLLIPLAVTAWVIYHFFTFVDGLLHFRIPGVGFLVTFATIVIVGALGSNLVAARFIVFLESFLNRVPLVKLIYFSIKDLIGAFVGEKKSFRFPVLVSLYPESGAKMLGFVTSQDPNLPGAPDHVAVYLPQSYNYSGFLIVVPRDRITPLPPKESARWLSFIVSGGVSKARRSLPTRANELPKKTLSMKVIFRMAPRVVPFAAFAVLALALLLAVTGCQRDGFWNRRRPVPAQLEISSTETADSSGVRGSTGKYGDFQEIFADVAAAALPAVVSIRSEMKVAAGDASDESDNDEASPDSSSGSSSGSGSETGSHHEEGLGSGVIIDSDGTILTNNHVIEGADRIQVQLYDNREFDAEILGVDPPSDLAVIRIKNAKETFPIMRLGNSDALRVGEWVLAVGSPYGLSQTVTTGIVSAKGRYNTGIDNYENFLQTDAAINPGNSGGALVNLRGELVGINTAIFSRSGGYQGIGFAIPINMAKKISADLIGEGIVTRGWLGVSAQLLDPDRAEALGVRDEKGTVVGGVVPGGPADKAGIQRGDVITRIDQAFIQNPNDLLNDVALRAPGTWAEVEVNRGGKSLVFKARIAKRDESRVASLQKQEK